MSPALGFAATARWGTPRTRGRAVARCERLIRSDVLTALSIVGIIIAWTPIWAGVMLMRAAGVWHCAFDSKDPLEI